MSYSGTSEVYYTEDSFTANQEQASPEDMSGMAEEAGVYSAIGAVFSSIQNLFVAKE